MWRSRLTRDIAQLKEAGFKVRGENASGEISDIKSFICNVKGPADSPFEGYEYDVRFTVSEQFPFKSPSVGFVQRIYHPNVDELSGSICLDSLNKTWSPAFTLMNIVEAQLPFLMQYPNAADPFNREAAAVLARSEDAYKEYAKQHCKKHARCLQTNGSNVE